MRLPADTIPRLLSAVRKVYGPTARVWLFGSRVDDSARGGDIDLYVETDLSDGIVAGRIRLLRELATIYGERKIDLVVRPRSRPERPIHRIARRDGISLDEAVGDTPCAASSAPAAG